jgi:hypothetical protein
MSDILYRPNLDYEKNYKSEGVFDKNTSNATTPNTVTDNKSIQSIQDMLNRIESILPSIPEDIARVFIEPLKGVQYLINQLDPTYYDPDYISSNNQMTISSPDEIITPTNNNSNDQDDFPSSVFSDVALWQVKIHNDDPIVKIEKEYNNIIGSMLIDYFNNLNQTVNKYLSNITVVVSQSGLNNIAFTAKRYSGVTTKIKNNNLMHVADSLVRSQIVRDQKQKMYKKLFNSNETITHVRACKIAKELKKRYYSENPVKNDDYLDYAKNIMLDNVKIAYDKKYKENLFNLYKYLNSSVILINECFSMFIQEAQAKAILIKEEGIKL